MNKIQEVAKEAICSALYNMPFSRFLGERPREGAESETAWFRLSPNPDSNDDPKQVMVAVECQTPGLVVLQVMWMNTARGWDNRLLGGLFIRIGTVASDDYAVKQATEQAVLRVLEIYNDVLTQTGVAGPVEEAAPESDAGDEDDPDDMARSDAEVGRE